MTEGRLPVADFRRFVGGWSSPRNGLGNVGPAAGGAIRSRSRRSARSRHSSTLRATVPPIRAITRKRFHPEKVPGTVVSCLEAFRDDGVTSSVPDFRRFVGAGRRRETDSEMSARLRGGAIRSRSRRSARLRHSSTPRATVPPIPQIILVSFICQRVSGVAEEFRYRCSEFLPVGTCFPRFR